VAERVELHETTTGEDGVSRMRKLDGLQIKPGETVELKPLGAHLMLIGLKGPLKEGDTFKAKLNFKNAGAVDVEFAVKASGGAAPAHQH
jgi:copper(I)-binding protein